MSKVLRGNTFRCLAFPPACGRIYSTAERLLKKSGRRSQGNRLGIDDWLRKFLYGQFVSGFPFIRYMPIVSSDPLKNGLPQRKLSIGGRKLERYERNITEPAREVPVIAEVDVVVVGAGPAGLGAAIAAARHGAKVLLMERYGYVGGMATGGLVLMLDRMGNDEGEHIVRGIAQEIVEKLDSLGAVIYPPKDAWGSKDAELVTKWSRTGAVGPQSRRVRYSPVIDPEYLKIVGARLLDEAGVKTLFHCWACSAIVCDRSVRGVVLESKSGRLAVLAKVTIDCTGDGDVVAYAGADFERQDLPLGLVFRVGGVDVDRADAFAEQNAEEFEALLKELAKSGGTAGGVGGFNRIYYRTVVDSVVWFNNAVPTKDALSIEELTRAEKERRETALATVGFFKKNMPGFEKAFLLDTAPQLGTRGSRRLKGEHRLTKEEWIRGKKFDDIIATCSPGTESEPLINVPFGCLLPEKVDNLLVAGRCLSVDLIMHNSLRLIPPCLATGQAAGVASALAVKQKVTPREIDRAHLRSLLVEDGVYLAQ